MSVLTFVTLPCTTTVPFFFLNSWKTYCARCKVSKPKFFRLSMEPSRNACKLTAASIILVCEFLAAAARNTIITQKQGLTHAKINRVSYRASLPLRGLGVARTGSSPVLAVLFFFPPARVFLWWFLRDVGLAKRNTHPQLHTYTPEL